jgi:hypothetical protein
LARIEVKMAFSYWRRRLRAHSRGDPQYEKEDCRRLGYHRRELRIEIEATELADLRIRQKVRHRNPVSMNGNINAGLRFRCAPETVGMVELGSGLGLVTSMSKSPFSVRNELLPDDKPWECPISCKATVRRSTVPPVAPLATV